MKVPQTGVNIEDFFVLEINILVSSIRELLHQMFHHYMLTLRQLITDTVITWSYKLSNELFGACAYQGVRSVSFPENSAHVVLSADNSFLFLLILKQVKHFRTTTRLSLVQLSFKIKKTARDKFDMTCIPMVYWKRLPCLSSRCKVRYK